MVVVFILGLLVSSLMERMGDDGGHNVQVEV